MRAKGDQFIAEHACATAAAECDAWERQTPGDGRATSPSQPWWTGRNLSDPEQKDRCQGINGNGPSWANEETWFASCCLRSPKATAVNLNKPMDGA